MAKIKSILTGREYDIPDADEQAESGSYKQISLQLERLIEAQAKQLIELQTLLDVERNERKREQEEKAAENAEEKAERQLLMDAKDAAEKALAAIKESSVQLDADCRERAARAEGELAAECAARKAAEQRAAEAEAACEKAEEAAELAAITQAINRAMAANKTMPPAAPMPAKKNMRVVVSERDGNGDIRTFLVKQD